MLSDTEIEGSLSIGEDLTVGINGNIYGDVDGDGIIENVFDTIDSKTNYWAQDGGNGIATGAANDNVTVVGNLIVNGSVDLGSIVGTNMALNGTVNAGTDITAGGNFYSTSTTYYPYPKNVKVVVTGDTTVNVTYDAIPIQGFMAFDGDLTATISSTNGIVTGKQQL